MTPEMKKFSSADVRLREGPKAAGFAATGHIYDL